MREATPMTGEEQAWTRLRRGSERTFAVHAFDTTLRLAIGIFLARWMGAAGYGAYMYAVSWVLILTVPAQLGSGRLVVRAVAADLARGRTDHLRGLVRGVTGLVLVAAIGLAAIVAVIFGVLAPGGDDAARHALLWALPMVPMAVVAIVARAALEGLQRVVRAQLPQHVVQPGLFAALVVIAAALGRGRSAVEVVVLAGVAFLATVLVGVFLLARALPPRTVGDPPSPFDAGAWLRQAFPMVLLAASQVINLRLDVVMLGQLGRSEDAGVYGAVTLGAGLLTLVHGAVGTTLAPLIVRLRAHGEHDAFQRLVTRALRRTLLMTVAGAIGMLVVAPWGLAWLGAEYERGWNPLAILCVGQILNVAAGWVGLILIMTHHERDAAVGLAIGAGANLALNLVLIPAYGIEGAAVATLVSTLIWNGLLIFQVRRHLGIDPTVWGRRPGG